MSRYFIVIRTEILPKYSEYKYNYNHIAEYNNIEEDVWGWGFDTNSNNLDAAIKKIFKLEGHFEPEIAYFETERDAREAAIVIRASEDPAKLKIQKAKSVEYYIVKKVGNKFIKTKV